MDDFTVEELHEALKDYPDNCTAEIVVARLNRYLDHKTAAMVSRLNELEGIVGTIALMLRGDMTKP